MKLASGYWLGTFVDAIMTMSVILCQTGMFSIHFIILCSSLFMLCYISFNLSTCLTYLASVVFCVLKLIRQSFSISCSVIIKVMMIVWKSDSWYYRWRQLTDMTAKAIVLVARRPHRPVSYLHGLAISLMPLDAAPPRPLSPIHDDGRQPVDNGWAKLPWRASCTAIAVCQDDSQTDWRLCYLLSPPILTRVLLLNTSV